MPAPPTTRAAPVELLLPFTDDDLAAGALARPGAVRYDRATNLAVSAVRRVAACLAPQALA